MKTNQSKSQAAKRSLLTDQKGLSTVEYIIILVLIAVAGIGGWQTFGGHVTKKIDESNTQFEGVKVDGAEGRE